MIEQKSLQEQIDAPAIITGKGFERMEAGFERMEECFKRMDRKFEQADKRLETLDTISDRLGDLENVVDGINTFAIGHERRISRLETKAA